MNLKTATCSDQHNPIFSPSSKFHWLLCDELEYATAPCQTTSICRTGTWPLAPGRIITHLLLAKVWEDNFPDSNSYIGPLIFTIKSIKLWKWLMTDLEQYFNTSLVLCSSVLYFLSVGKAWHVFWIFIIWMFPTPQSLGTFIQRYCLVTKLPNQNWAHIFLWSSSINVCCTLDAPQYCSIWALTRSCTPDIFSC